MSRLVKPQTLIAISKKIVKLVLMTAEHIKARKKRPNVPISKKPALSTKQD